MSIRNIGFISLLLFFLVRPVFTQTFSWDWARKISASNWASGQILAIDALNNYYFQFSYSGNIIFPDTSFSGNDLGDIVIGKYDQFGNFRHAFKLHSIEFIDDVFGVCDDSLNLYVGGYFTSSLVLQDTILYAGTTGDLFIAKLNESGILQWINTIRGNHQDYFTGLIISHDQMLYLAGNNGGSSTYPGITIFFGKDTVIHQHTLFYTLKFDRNGNIIWRRDGLTLNGGDFFHNLFFQGQDQNFYTNGSNYGDLLLGYHDHG